MAKSKQPSADSDLLCAIRELCNQVRLLSTVMDDLVTEVQWLNRNRRSDDRAPFMLTSLPADPTTTDWQVNKVSATDLPAKPITPKSKRPESLFE
jgi:hypothetical protein